MVACRSCTVTIFSTEAYHGNFSFFKNLGGLLTFQKTLAKIIFVFLEILTRI